VKTFEGIKTTANLSPKIGIITYYRNGSYGAALQAFALQSYLKQAGYESKLIRYTRQWPPPLTIFEFFCSRSLSSVYNKFISLLHRRFTDKFADNFIIETTCFHSKEALQHGLPEMNVFVCGSDQIWNPWVYEQSGYFDDCYFLSFVPNACAKISYAASFGRSELPAEYADSIKPLLNRFDYISVRESSGVHLLADMDIDAEQVLDPSFLPEKKSFQALAKIKGKYGKEILVFILGSDRSIYLPVCKRLADVSGLRCDIISPCIRDIFKNWVNPCFPTVTQWLGMFIKTPFVFTDSFHGTVFSIIFNKPFILLLRAGGRKGKNSRLTSLLKFLDLEDRIIDRYDYDKIDELYKKEINWDFVNNKVNSEKEKSRSFLKKALERVAFHDEN
jgi:hypothetical protein